DLTGALHRSADRQILPEAGRKDRVMVVEDSPIVNRVYREILERHRFDYQIVAEPTVALAAIRDFMPDLILMDAQMPEIDGFSLTGMIRAEKRFSNVRIIMVTSDQKTESFLKALQIGASDFVTKPFNEEVLLARMRVHLNNKRLYDDLAAAFGELRELKNKLERLSTTDGLSGLYNHRHFYELFLAETGRSKREKTPLSFLMCDIDHFKKFNDTWGHLAGDKVIQAVARTVKETCRAYDIVARYGGEEFAVLAPDTDMEGIAQLAERIRSAVELLEVPLDGEVLRVTSSGGFAVWNGTESVKDLIKRADEALYVSKKGGRNRVTPG
ncbi:MAG: diguanylate cyclase, partial [Nitrospinae bacterium]|nr:diguanylate cyclase [Nitrospinota bacterium]